MNENIKTLSSMKEILGELSAGRSVHEQYKSSGDIHSLIFLRCDEIKRLYGFDLRPPEFHWNGLVDFMTFHYFTELPAIPPDYQNTHETE